MTGLNTLDQMVNKADYPACYWVIGDDCALNYCRPCAEKELGEQKQTEHEPLLDGGWLIHHDSAPFCETCEKPLEYLFTDYGAELEVAYYSENGVPWPLTPEDAYHLSNIEGCLIDPWKPLEEDGRVG